MSFIVEYVLKNSVIMTGMYGFCVLDLCENELVNFKKGDSLEREDCTPHESFYWIPNYIVKKLLQLEELEETNNLLNNKLKEALLDVELYKSKSQHLEAYANLDVN